MSFILDALKKSETDRQQQGPSDFANVPSSNESPRTPRWLWVLAVLLAVNLVVLLGVLLRDDTPQEVPQSVQAPPADPEPAAASSFSERIQEARERESAVRPIAAPPPESVAEPERGESADSAVPRVFGYTETLARRKLEEVLARDGRLMRRSTWTPAEPDAEGFETTWVLAQEAFFKIFKNQGR